jgi:hypothetical protein
LNGGFKGIFGAPWSVDKNMTPLPSTGDLDLKIARDFLLVPIFNYT